MAIERLDGRATSRGPLRTDGVRRGRFPEERDAVVYAGAGDRPVIRLKHFAGRPSAGVRPWIEAAIERGDEAFAAELVAALATLLPPGGYLMVGYGDDETERGLKRGFPPVATPLGMALLRAGCTWFKDWYYPEGGMEGGLKLQGNMALTGGAREAQVGSLRAELLDWLETSATLDDGVARRARARARSALEALEL